MATLSPLNSRCCQTKCEQLLSFRQPSFSKHSTRPAIGNIATTKLAIAKFLANIHQEIGYSTCIGQVLETITQWRDGLTHSWWTETTSFNLQQATLRSQKTSNSKHHYNKAGDCHTTQARRHHATVDPVLVHDRRPHRRSKYWGGKFCFLPSTFIMINWSYLYPRKELL